MPKGRLLRAYMGAVVAIAAPTVVLAAMHGADAFPGHERDTLPLIIVLFCIVLIAGELWPIPVARGQEAGDEITVSSAFGFGLLFIAPVLIPVAAQALALIIDAVWRRRPVDRLLFNIGQYALAFIGARAVYSALTGVPFTPYHPVPLPGLLPALGAGLTFLLINNTLVAIAVSISVQMRLGRLLVDDLRWQVTTSAPLLGLGPLAVQAMFWTPAAIVLLLMPIVALHHSGTMAMRREQEARRDALTGLANRAMLTSVTTETLSKSVGQVAMLLLDLDHFKEINDTLGHGVGDQMLVTVAQRLSSSVGTGDLVARLGGDEFVVLARGLQNADAAVEFADRLCTAVREPVVLNGVTLTVGCSVGIAFGPQHADTVSGLLRCADIALYTAKVTRGNAAVYNKEDDRHSAARLGLQADLRQALENEEDTQIWVAYQPQLRLVTGQVESVECLARWRHPELGDIGPDVFIPIAESASLIDLVLHRVLDASLIQLADWDRLGLHLKACVNLSARQVSDVTLPGTVRRQLARHRIPADRLILEVTESLLMSDPETSAGVIRELHELGVQISIDDFGTGYSSLAYLQRLAVDELKIDMSFITQLSQTGDATIVRSTIDLGHNLGHRVVAEGVEDEAILRQLGALGCDLVQGYFVGRPVPGCDIPAVVETAQARTSRQVRADSPDQPHLVRLVQAPSSLSTTLRKAQ